MNTAHVIPAATDALCAAGHLEPLRLGGADEAAWFDCELASMAEHRLRDLTDPRNLDPVRREHWLRRATSAPALPPSRRRFESAFWLLDSGERVGTLAIGRDSGGSARVPLSSLYVFPDHRGRGVGQRALRHAGAAAVRSAEGLHLTPESPSFEDPFAFDGLGTLVLHLALRGWPLIRSPEMLETRGHADACEPESLALRIEAWEAWDRHHGWHVDTPRIPGLAYRDWDTLEADWERA